MFAVVLLLSSFLSATYRSTHRRSSIKKYFLKNFPKFSRKTHVLIFRSAISLKIYFNKGASLQILQSFWEHILWRTSSNGCFCILSKNIFRTLSDMMSLFTKIVNGFQALFSIFLTLSRSLLLPDIFYLFLWLTKYKINLVARICELQHILYLKYGNVIKSAQNGVAAFNYFLLLKFYWFINKVISVMLCL